MLRQTYAQTLEAVVCDPPDDTADFSRVGGIQVTEADGRGPMQTRGVEIRIGGCDKFIPIRFEVPQLATDAAEKKVLERPWQEGENEGRPQLGRPSGNLRKRDEDDITRFHSRSPCFTSSIV